MINKYHSDAAKRINEFRVLYAYYYDNYQYIKGVLFGLYETRNKAHSKIFIKHYNYLIFCNTHLLKQFRRQLNYFAKKIKENKATCKHFNRKYNKYKRYE